MAYRPASENECVADVMLRHPKTLPIDARVSDARAVLENPSVQMVLLTTGSNSPGQSPAYLQRLFQSGRRSTSQSPAPETIGPNEPASAAFARTAANPHHRIVVVDDVARLLGLLCLDKTRTRFCGRTGTGTVG